MDTSKVNAGTLRSLRVRLAERKDAERITTVINSAFRRAEGFFIDDDRIDVVSVLNFLETGKFLLAENAGTILGCVYVEPRPFLLNDRKFSRAYLGLLAVDSAHQRSGLGSVLMEAAEDYCQGLGVSFMDIKVVSLRDELFGFYRRRGYVETGTSPFPEHVETKLACHFIDMSKPLRDLIADQKDLRR